MPLCSSGPIRSRRLGAQSRECSIAGRAIPQRTFLIMPPGVRAPRPPTACSRAMGAHGWRSELATHTRRSALDMAAPVHRGGAMNAARTLHELGQSLWLDNITRNLLRTGVLRRYIDELAVTGLTSNPTIFDHAIKNSNDYDDAIKSKLAHAAPGEKLFLELALEDVTEAADLFRPV